MGTYRVVSACAWLNDDGSAAVHRKPGAVVEISDKTAAELGDAVTPLNGVSADVKPKNRPREPKTKPEPKPVEQPSWPSTTPESEPAAPDASPDVASASGE